MLVGGIDVSGNQAMGNYRFMGIVLGTKENLDAMTNNLQLDKISASTLKHKEIRNSLVSKLEFNMRESIGFCVWLDRNKTIPKTITEIGFFKRKLIYRKYNQLLLKSVLDRINEFVSNYRIELSEIPFQCDDDCRGFIRDNNLTLSERESVHTMADLVAWSNNHNKKLDGVIHLDPRNEVRTGLNKYYQR